MSLGGAFVNAVEAMIAQSNALGVISQNVANINTTGYKTESEDFQTLLSGTDGSVASPSVDSTGGLDTLNTTNYQFGVQGVHTQQVDKQGDVATTGLWNNLAISGEGMFVVSQQTGSSALDAQGQAVGPTATGNVVASGTALTGSVPFAYTRDGILSEQAGSSPTGITTVTLGNPAAVAFDDTDTQTSAGPTSVTAYFSDGTQSTISLDFSQLTQSTTGTSQISDVINDGVAATAGQPGTPTTSLQLQGSLASDSSSPVTVTVPVVDANGTSQNMQLLLTPSSSGSAATTWTVAAEPIHTSNPTVYLTTGQGNYLMGWQAVNGVVTPSTDASSLTAIHFTTGSAMAGQQTTSVGIQATLPSGSSTAQAISVPVYDDQFNAQTMQISFNPSGATNSWTVGFGVPAEEASGTVDAPATPDTVAFDGSGNFDASNSSSSQVNIAWADGTSSSIALDLSQMSQINGGNFQISNVAQNGVGPGTGNPTEPTTTMQLMGSLPSDGSTGPFTEATTVYDTSGTPRTVNLTFTQTDTDTWTVSAAIPPPPAPTVTVASSVPSGGTITTPTGSSPVTFDTTGAVSSGGATSLGINWTDGTSSAINLDLSQLTQVAAGVTNGSISATADGDNTGTDPTGTVTVTGEVPPNSPDQVTTNVQVYDNAGTAHTVQLQLTEGTDNSWNVTASLAPTLKFDGTGAVIGSPSATVNVTWPDGTTVPVTVDLSKMKQLNASTVQIQAVNQNGFGAGNLVSENFDSQGNFYGEYSNGQKQVLYQVAIADFPNYNGLTEESGNLYLSNDYQVNGVNLPTTGSGAGQLVALPSTSISPESLTPGGSGGPSIVAGAVEQSNVDLGQQFSNMIIAQQAYNSASQTFKAADQMMETLRDLVTG